MIYHYLDEEDEEDEDYFIYQYYLMTGGKLHSKYHFIALCIQLSASPLLREIMQDCNISAVKLKWIQWSYEAFVGHAEGWDYMCVRIEKYVRTSQIKYLQTL